MSQKRRDNKNRILQTGESQRKDGRYAYKYVDAYGKPQFVYSWKLVHTDKTPAGKREDLSLREKKRQIEKNLEDGINSKGGKMTVTELYQKWIRLNTNVRPQTHDSRQLLLNQIEKDGFGFRQIETVKMSDAKEWLIQLRGSGIAYSTIRGHKRCMSAIFYSAVQDDYIRKNPFEFDIREVLVNDTPIKEALTLKQQSVFLAFVKNDKTYRKYYDEMLILLKTCIRISELCGLTDNEVDLDNRTLTIDHQLLRKSGIGYYIMPPKSESGNRTLYMTDEVHDAFVRIFENRKKSNFTVEGYKNFLFLKKDGNPKTVTNYESVFSCLMKKFHKTAKEDILPQRITPHILRHTFCTNMANKGMNPKALQYIMGHKSIHMTMNYYAHATYESVMAEMQRVA